MSITVKTTKPRTLLSSIKNQIDSGALNLWSYDAEGDFSYEGEYSGKAWLRVQVLEDQLRFYVLTPKGTVMGTSTYAIYHARWTEMLLENFDTEFTDATISALPSVGDVIKDEAASD